MVWWRGECISSVAECLMMLRGSNVTCLCGNLNNGGQFSTAESVCTSSTCALNKMANSRLYSTEKSVRFKEK